jgi:hypothetical protein
MSLGSKPVQPGQFQIHPRHFQPDLKPVLTGSLGSKPVQPGQFLQLSPNSQAGSLG